MRRKQSFRWENGTCRQINPDLIDVVFPWVLHAADRKTVRAIGGVRRIDDAIAAEAQAVHEVAASRRGRPRDVVDTDIVQAAIAAASTTRSRIPDGTC